MTKTIQTMGRSVLSVITIATFALLPFAGVAVAQEAPGEVCTPTSATIVSNSETQVDGGAAVAVDTLAGAWTADIDGATWIWSDAQVEADAAPGIEVFTRDFEWSSDATSTATLEIATDNTYSVTVNTQDAGASLDEDNFSSADVIDISEFLVDGTNSIEITVENLGPDDSPAGLLYRIDLAGFDCEDPLLPTGEIISPTEGETVSGIADLVAVYTDGDEENDDEVQWAVRPGMCDADPVDAVFGNVDGQSDDFDWNGSLFDAEIDTTTVDDGEYCFVFNPTDDGEVDVRETVNFNILNEGTDPVATTTVTVTKVIVNDDGGTATTSDFMLLVGDMEVESGVETEIEAGTYVVDEFGTSTADYTATFSGDCDAQGNITINEGDNLECTITNDDIDQDPGLPGDPALQCGDAWARVVVEDFSNEGTGDVSDTIFLGSSGNTVASGEWFMIVEDGVAIDDADISGYQDVPGLAVERSDGEVRVVLHGSQGADDLEDVNGRVEFSGTAAISVVEDPANLLEASDNASLSGGDVAFQMLTNVANDGFIASYDEVSAEDCATVTVTKVIVNDDGRTATTSDFTLLVGDTEVESGQSTVINSGTYVIDEFGPLTAGYEATFSGDCDAEGNLTATVGGEFECTITNDDLPIGPDQCVAVELDLVSDGSVEGWVAVDNATSTAGNQIPAEWTADIDGATWIWVDAQEDATAATGTEVYTRDFQFESDATSTATLEIATDNSYEVRLNGVLVGSSADEVNFTLATQDTIDLSAELVDGTNTLEISVTNEDNGTENPAGLLYSLELTGFDCEEPDVPGDDDDDDDDQSSGGGGGSRFAGDRGDDDDDDDDDDGEVLGETTTRNIDFFIPGVGGTGGAVAGVGFPATGAGGVNGLAVMATIGILTTLLGTLFLVRKTLIDLEKGAR